MGRTAERISGLSWKQGEWKGYENLERTLNNCRQTQLQFPSCGYVFRASSNATEEVLDHQPATGSAMASDETNHSELSEENINDESATTDVIETLEARIDAIALTHRSKVNGKAMRI